MCMFLFLKGTVAVIDLCFFLCVHMKKWFEKAWCLWVEDGAHANEMMLHLAEDFFDALMVSDF